jgi:hypothetical protein
VCSDNSARVARFPGSCSDAVRVLDRAEVVACPAFFPFERLWLVEVFFVGFEVREALAGASIVVVCEFI